MATYQLTPPDMSIIDIQSFYDETEIDQSVFQSNDSMDDYLINELEYTQSQVDGMTQNDKIYAIRLLAEPAEEVE